MAKFSSAFYVLLIVLLVLTAAAMGSKELAYLCENLSIHDDDSEIHQISGGIERDGVEDINHCLVGKVLANQRINREAFKSVIEQLWSLFGPVDIEVVGENIFLFYFTNPADRDRIWQRGPWHFDRSLIELERPEGTGKISQLGFNRAEFWVQIHDIPLLCMNRRMAKWLAEQIGEVIEIPSESRDCWGKFLRVKVLIDISRPLKRLGHSIGDCSDVEGKKVALAGPVTRFGSWLRASPMEKVNVRSSSMGSGGTLEKEKSLGESSRRDSERSSKRIMEPVDRRSDRLERPETVDSRKTKAVDLDSPGPVANLEIVQTDGLGLDGPRSGPQVEAMDVVQDLDQVVKGKNWKRLAKETQKGTSEGFRFDGMARECSKRRVNFEVDDLERGTKRGKITGTETPSAYQTSTAEPAGKARREP
ncbi:hypothetical protein EZV62_013372 [Acer yangbiense]|uniref:DUF4283 domain-containing protein n=1 Tax=Acer yangbiense TaxID=1000413 RepID=A0A5C7HZ89_9ROSI|nr:hypothetical protein EZV62_013372 [Acer yangbiense]